MDKKENSEAKNGFLSDPRIVENYSLLQEIGIFDHIDSLNGEIRNYRNLFEGALDIINRISIDEIMNATVWQISDRFLPSFITFLWKPMQNREDITIRSYKNNKPVDLKLRVENLKTFEPFFRDHLKPVKYELFSAGIAEKEAFKFFDGDDIMPELVIPILGLSGLYGLVLVGHKILENEYTERELVFIQNLMSFVSKAIQSHLNYERTLRDPKTGLYNNGFLLTRLNEEIARAKRTQSVASVIMMDVDKFKNFNDSYGHIAGDKVLENLAVTIKKAVRTDDVPSRFGGEEFTVLLPNTDKDGAIFVAERIRTMVEAMKIEWNPPLPRVTISLGVFTLGKETNLSAEEIIKRADEALYLSKERGRNRTTAWGDGLFEKVKRQTGE